MTEDRLAIDPQSNIDFCKCVSDPHESGPSARAKFISVKLDEVKRSTLRSVT
jgi:hypothetical protein